MHSILIIWLLLDYYLSKAQFVQGFLMKAVKKQREREVEFISGLQMGFNSQI